VCSSDLKKEPKQEKITPTRKAIAPPKITNLVGKENIETENESLKTDAKPIVSEVSDHIFLVAASFKTQEKAELGITELIQKGFADAVILPKTESETYFRISLGSAKSMDLAYMEAANLKKEKKIDIWVFKKD
jgi:phosphoribosyl-ATP pyrophosphohydrolase